MFEFLRGDFGEYPEFVVLVGCGAVFVDEGLRVVVIFVSQAFFDGGEDGVAVVVEFVEEYVAFEARRRAGGVFIGVGVRFGIRCVVGRAGGRLFWDGVGLVGRIHLTIDGWLQLMAGVWDPEQGPQSTLCDVASLIQNTGRGNRLCVGGIKTKVENKKI